MIRCRGDRPYASRRAAAVIAGIVAAFGTILSWRTATRTRSELRRSAKAERLHLQLDEFYGPLQMRRAETRMLRGALPPVGSDGNRWRLVDHLAEAFQSDKMHPDVDQIIAENDKVADLIISKAGLIAGSRPNSFDKFLEHRQLMKLCWANEGKGVGEGGRSAADAPFPDEFDDDIAEGRRIVDQDPASNT